MEAVARVIARQLRAGRAIGLPSLGVLYVFKHDACLIDSMRRLTSPAKELAIGHFHATDVAEYIAWDLDISLEQAQEIYYDWLCNSTSEGRIYIEGVCSVDISTMTVDADAGFVRMLNPLQGDKIIVNATNAVAEQKHLTPIKKQSKVGVVISVFAAIGAFGYLVYYFWDYIMELLP